MFDVSLKCSVRIAGAFTRRRVGFVSRGLPLFYRNNQGCSSIILCSASHSNKRNLFALAF